MPQKSQKMPFTSQKLFFSQNFATYLHKSSQYISGRMPFKIRHQLIYPTPPPPTGPVSLFFQFTFFQEQPKINLQEIPKKKLADVYLISNTMWLEIEL